MKVIVPTPLRSYSGRREVEASGTNFAEVLADLDRQFPGFRFRFFVNGSQVPDLARPLLPTDRLVIVPALSGG
jgi:sulfur-carrier protein